MKKHLVNVVCASTVVLLLGGAYRLGVRNEAAKHRPACEIRRSSHDGKTIEVWRSGELADEWQPDDGVIYTTLNHVLRDEMPPEAQKRALDRLNKRRQIVSR